VDATYLSPHVNMAARMETASRQYHVSLLMTENFYEVGVHVCVYVWFTRGAFCVRARRCVQPCASSGACMRPPPSRI
jgi:class 3 adenylate cyclase